MEYGEEFHIAEGERVGNEKREEVERIENAGLNVADERHTTEQVRIPEWNHTTRPPLGGEFVRRIEELREVAAARRHPHLPGKQAPKKAGSRHADNADCQHIAPGITRATTCERNRKNDEPDYRGEKENHRVKCKGEAFVLS